VLPYPLDVDARVRVEAAELEALVALRDLDAGPAEVVEDRRDTRLASTASRGAGIEGASSSKPLCITRRGEMLVAVASAMSAIGCRRLLRDHCVVEAVVGEPRM
jgi:hypothetical protein